MRSKYLMILPVLGLVAGCGETADESNTTDGSISTPAQDLAAAPAQDLVAASDGQQATILAEDLQFLREEEKLARDVYRTLYARWKVNIFNNISKSEQQHTDAVKALLVARSIADPVTDDTVGVFKDKTLDGLFSTLTSKGSVSEVEALIVGAIIEDLDIQDIALMKVRTSDKEVLAVYDRLQCGSRNHLRSFVAQITARGGTYSPQYISITTYQGILQTSGETCGL